MALQSASYKKKQGAESKNLNGRAEVPFWGIFPLTFLLTVGSPSQQKGVHFFLGDIPSHSSAGSGWPQPAERKEKCLHPGVLDPRHFCWLCFTPSPGVLDPHFSAGHVSPPLFLLARESCSQQRGELKCPLGGTSLPYLSLGFCSPPHPLRSSKEQNPKIKWLGAI